MQIKAQLGKLDLDRPLQEIISEQDKDPFDQLLVAQAIVEGISIVSVEPLVAQYPVQVVAS